MAQIVQTGPITRIVSETATKDGTAIVPSGLMPSRFGQIRRIDLYRLADAWDVDYPADAPATEMRQLLERAGIDLAAQPPRPLAARPAPKVAVVAEDKPVHRVAPAVDFATADMGELRKACKGRGIALKRTDKRVDMLEKLGHGQNAA